MSARAGPRGVAAAASRNSSCARIALPASKRWPAASTRRRTTSSRSAGGVSSQASSASSAAESGAPRARAERAASSSAAAIDASGPADDSARWRARSSGSMARSARARWTARRSSGEARRIDRGRQQRVREADVAGSDLDDAGLFGCGEGIVCREIQPGCRRNEVRRRLGRRRDDQEGQRRTGRKDVDPCAEQLLEVPGNGQGGSRTRPVVFEHPRDLEGEEGIAVRVLVDAAQEGPRPRTAQASSKHRLERAEAQRPKGDAMQSIR